MFTKLLFGFTLSMLIGCVDNKPNAENQTLDFGSFSIVTPKGWSKISTQGTDSYVGRIAIDNTDTIHFDLGWYSNKLRDSEPQIIERSMLNNMNDFDTSQFIIVDSRNSIDLDNFKKTNISWDSIDGRKAKIVFPIKSGIGTTGIYIDSLWQKGLHADRFNLYGTNLKPANEKLLLQALKTLKFHKIK